MYSNTSVLLFIQGKGIERKEIESILDYLSAVPEVLHEFEYILSPRLQVHGEVQSSVGILPLHWWLIRVNKSIIPYFLV